METIVLVCSCSHSYQDKVYGVGKRLHYVLKSGVQARCTVCRTLHSTVKKETAVVKKR